MENSIRETNAQLQTPVQVKLPNTLEYKDGLLIVQDDKTKHDLLAQLQDLSGLGAQLNGVESIEELKKNKNAKKFLNQFD